LNKLLGRIIGIFYKPLIQWYVSSDRTYNYKDIKLLIKKGVFHPGLFSSTKLLLENIEKLELRGKSLLELGAGSGVISFRAWAKGADVTASDINPIAIEGLTTNLSHVSAAPTNKFNILLSDLFDKIPAQTFDFIIVNPPFYKGNPDNFEEHAWYAGSNFEYFKRFFYGIKDYIGSGTVVLVAFADIPELKIVRQLAGEMGYRLEDYIKKGSIFQDQLILKLYKVSDVAAV